ncbi:MAG: hypothetical protein IJU61_00485 [Victivallales bacterium]|jgi:hypothetical protein|nr:hypothetical protein [Victivallales bacterium]
MKNFWQILAKGAIYILLAVMGYFGKLAVTQLLTIQKELAAINVQLAEVRKDMLTKDDVRDIVKVELLERGIK